MEKVLLAAGGSFGEIVLVRHGQQGDNGFNDPARPKGGNVALSDLGVRQARVTADELAISPVDAVYCSPLLRASMTGQAIADRHGLTAIVDPDLAEVQIFRDLAPGQNVIDALGPDGLAEVHEKFEANRLWNDYPLSETREELRARLARALARILAAHSEPSRVVIACHGGVINAFLGQILGLDVDMFMMPGHASISRIARGKGRLEIVSMNETGHLRRSPDARLTF